MPQMSNVVRPQSSVPRKRISKQKQREKRRGTNVANDFWGDGQGGGETPPPLPPFKALELATANE